MTLAEMEQDLYDRFGYQASPPTEIVRRIRRFINEAHREAIGKKWASSFRRALLTFSSVANSPFAVIPQAATRIITIADRTNNIELTETSLADLRYTDPGLTALAGYPNQYVTLNYSAAVAKDPANASSVFIISDNAGDVQTAYIEGIRTGGYPQSKSVVLTGVTAVNVSAAVSDWIAITRFWLSSAAVGTVELHEDSGAGTELAHINQGRTMARYTRLHLYPVPTAAVVLYADVDRQVLDMSVATDEPLIHEDWHYLVVAGASAKEFFKREKLAESDREYSRFTTGMREMQTFLSQRSGSATGPNRQPARFSQLGPNFSPGS